MTESKEASLARLELLNEAVSVCRSINDMTELWQGSGLEWNTDIMSKFYVTSCLMKDVTSFLKSERSKDKVNEEADRDHNVDLITSTFIHDMVFKGSIMDVDAHDFNKKFTNDEIEEALKRIDNLMDYKVVRPTVRVANEGDWEYNCSFRFVARDDVSSDEIFDYAWNRVKESSK